MWFNAADLIGFLRTQSGEYLHINSTMFACISEDTHPDKVFKRLSDLQGRCVEVELDGSKEEHNLKVKKVYVTLLASNY